MTVQVNWKQTTEERYWEMLGALPPALMEGGGFLVGEPMDYRTCTVEGRVLATYEAFFERDEKFFQADHPLTIPEFKAANQP